MPELDLHRLARSTTFTLAAALAFVAPPLATGIASAWHTIFVLGEFSEKFGQRGTFNLSVTMQTSFWVFTALIFSIARWILSRVTRSSPPFSRVLLASLLVGALASAVVLADVFRRQLSEFWFAIGPIAAALVHLTSRSAKSAASTA